VGGEPIPETMVGDLDPRIVTLEPTIRAAAGHFGVPTSLLAATLQRESRGDLTAVGDGGESLGAGQIQAPTADTINRYWRTNLDRSNWVHNIYLSAGNLRRLYNEMSMSWWPFSGLGSGWYHSERGYLCGKRGAEQNENCAATEARKRLILANMENQIPES
jgi:hypothetical protein